MPKFKRLKYLALPLIGGALLLGSVYGATSLMSLNNDSTTSVMNLSARADVRSKPLSESGYTISSKDINVSSVIDADGNYILPAKKGNNAAVVKLSQSGAFLYAWDFSSSNYAVREIVKDTDDEGYYYVLLASDSFSMTLGGSNAETAEFTLTNESKVVQIKDEGASFSTNNTYKLEMPEFKNSSSRNGTSVWNKIYVENPIVQDTQNSQLRFIHSNNNGGGAARTEKNKISGLFEKTRGNDYDTALTNLYKNCAKNMAYISHNDKKMILIFGGSDAQSLWFYDFFVTTKKESAEKSQKGLLYANYAFDFNTTADEQYDVSQATTYSNAYKYKALENNVTRTKNIAWFVGGAKTVTRKKNSFVLLSMMEPNYSNYKGPGDTTFPSNGVTNGQEGTYSNLLIGASSINSMPPGFRSGSGGSSGRSGNGTINTSEFDKWNKGSFRSRTIWTSISSKTAFDVASDSATATKIFDTDKTSTARMNISTPKEWTKDNQVDKWNHFSTTIGGSNPQAAESFSGTNGSGDKDGDGLKNSVSQKMILFDPQVIERYDEKRPTDISEEFAALTLVRGQIGIVFYKLSQGTPTIDLAKDAVWLNISYMNDMLDFDNLKSVTYKDNTWFLNYVDNSKSQVYALSYGGHNNGSPIVTFSSTNVEGKTTANSFNTVLPVNNDSLFTVVKSSNQEVNFWKKPKGGLASDFTKSENFNSSSPLFSDNKDMWGTISRVDESELSQRDLLSKPAVDIASDPDLLSGLINFAPGWDGQAKPIIFNAKATGNNVSFDVALQHPNGNYYTSSSNVDHTRYPNIVTDSSIGNLSFSYDGFSALPAWVLPTAIGGGIGFVVILGTLGVVFGIPMYMSRKLQEKGFTSTFNKVDNLTAAVGSVYKKIVAQTGNVKKQPQMLKAAKPGTPGAPAAGKPAAPGAAPTKPVAPAAGAAPKAPGAPAAAPGAAPKAPGAPAAPK